MTVTDLGPGGSCLGTRPKSLPVPVLAALPESSRLGL